MVVSLSATSMGTSPLVFETGFHVWHWPRTAHLPKGELELLMLLAPYSSAAAHLGCWVGILLRALYTPCKHSPSLRFFFHLKITTLSREVLYQEQFCKLQIISQMEKKIGWWLRSSCSFAIVKTSIYWHCPYDFQTWAIFLTVLSWPSHN